MRRFGKNLLWQATQAVLTQRLGFGICAAEQISALCLWEFIIGSSGQTLPNTQGPLRRLSFEAFWKKSAFAGYEKLRSRSAWDLGSDFCAWDLRPDIARVATHATKHRSARRRRAACTACTSLPPLARLSSARVWLSSSHTPMGTLSQWHTVVEAISGTQVLLTSTVA